MNSKEIDEIVKTWKELDKFLKKGKITTDAIKREKKETFFQVLKKIQADEEMQKSLAHAVFSLMDILSVNKIHKEKNVFEAFIMFLIGLHINKIITINAKKTNKKSK